MSVLGGRAFLAAVAGRRRGLRQSSGDVINGGLRFAFYGRMSTEEFQDEVTSQAWQRAVSEELIEGFGTIVAEFFDDGRSRRWSWSDRRAASALLAAAEAPDRAFDAVVVGEYERAFHGDQFRLVVERLNAAGVEVWLPEAGGPVELDSPVHQALMVLLGAQARREVVRARHRVLAAMRAQTRVQGRFLGGRPPYGYRLADGGPHPNVIHARWGRRLHVLEPDPVTARWVEWMFMERARGRSVASLVRELNDRGVPCPSSVDPGRNGHRSGERWIVRTVAMILENPRYTGRQVWNRQSTRGHGVGGRAGGRGSGAVQSNPVGEWEVSERRTHRPLVDDTTFLAVQEMRTGRMSKAGEIRRYALAGLVVCGVCGRRMDAHWVHGRAGYRCRHGWHDHLHAGLTNREVFAHTSLREPALSAASQAGMVNNLNDGLAMGLFPILFVASGLSISETGILTALYPLVWGLGQLATGPLSDRWGRKHLVTTGMLTQAAALALIALVDTFTGWAVAAVLLGAGTAMVYPTLLAVIGDVAHPTWRARAVGVYRLWRDGGFAVGAIISGIVADVWGLRAAVWVVATITAASGVIVAVRMYETHPRAHRDTTAAAQEKGAS